jgi:hypothetical protein
MAPTDLDTLLDMGFEKQRAELAVKKTGGRTFCSTLAAATMCIRS